MNEVSATELARVLGGRAEDTGAGMWNVVLVRADGKIVVFSGDCVCEYDSEENYEEGRSQAMIALAPL
jgi:NDP-sugar pyrophosphorylase family protein